VICSIHQPRADVFHKFDAVLILSKGGHAVFCGTTDSLINYFSDLGYRCPDTSNPADYFVDLSSIELKKGMDKDDVDDDIEVSVSRVNRLITSFKEYQEGQQQVVTEYLQKHPHISTIDAISSQTSSSKSFKNSWFIQVWGCSIQSTNQPIYLSIYLECTVSLIFPHRCISTVSMYCSIHVYFLYPPPLSINHIYLSIISIYIICIYYIYICVSYPSFSFIHSFH
jgi:hypothetical protein